MEALISRSMHSSSMAGGGRMNVSMALMDNTDTAGKAIERGWSFLGESPWMIRLTSTRRGH